MQRFVEEFIQHLPDNVGQIFLELESGLLAGLEEMPGEEFCPVTWEQFEVSLRK